MKKMRSSTVLAHPACATIDRAIAANEALTRIATRFGLTKWAVARRRDMLARDYAEYLNAIRSSSKGR